jgi:hypothetical protein
MYSLALIIFVVSEKKAFEHFPIVSNVNLCIAVAAILGPGMIIGRSSTNFMLFMTIGNPRWPPPYIFVLTGTLLKTNLLEYCDK